MDTALGDVVELQLQRVLLPVPDPFRLFVDVEEQGSAKIDLEGYPLDLKRESRDLYSRADEFNPRLFID